MTARSAAPNSIAAPAIVTVMATVAMIASAPGQSFVIALYVDHIVAGAGIDRPAFAIVYAVATVGSALGAVVLGSAIDRSGIRAAWALAALGLAAGCFATSYATGALAVLVGITLLRVFGQGSFPLISKLTVVMGTTTRRGRSMSIASTGLVAAGVLLPVVVASAIDQFGWQVTMRATGIVLLLTVLPVALLASSRETSGLSGRTAKAPSLMLRLRSVPPGAWWPMLALATPPLIITSATINATVLFGSRGSSAHVAAIALATLAASGFLGVAATGFVVDRFGVVRALSAMALLILAGSVVLMAPSSSTTLLAFALFGISGAVASVAAGVIWAESYGLSLIGGLQGTATGVQVLAAAAGPLPLGLSQALLGSLNPGIALLAGVSALPLIALARWPANGRSELGNITVT